MCIVNYNTSHTLYIHFMCILLIADVLVHKDVTFRLRSTSIYIYIYFFMLGCSSININTHEDIILFTFVLYKYFFLRTYILNITHNILLLLYIKMR